MPAVPKISYCPLRYTRRFVCSFNCFTVSDNAVTFCGIVETVRKNHINNNKSYYYANTTSYMYNSPIDRKYTLIVKEEKNLCTLHLWSTVLFTSAEN